MLGLHKCMRLNSIIIYIYFFMYIFFSHTTTSRSDNSTVHLRSVACSGYEESIFDCQQEVGGVVCSHNVAIECSKLLILLMIHFSVY